MDTVTKQEPIYSQFNANSTAEDIVEQIDLEGKVAVITGGDSGVGLEMTKALANAGTKVVVPVRDIDKAYQVLKDIPNIEIGILNLMEPESVDLFANWFLSTNRPLDILINDAGIMNPPLRRDSRGYESQFSTNHLGHFQLSARLWPALRKANAARVVAVSSRAQRLGGVLFEDPNFQHTEYDGMVAYAQSKTANILFAFQLDKLARKYNIRAFAAHPGLIPTTDLGFNKTNANVSKLIKDKTNLTETINITSIINTAEKLNIQHIGDEFKTVKQGAATPIWCAVSPELNGKGGVYCEDCNIAFAVTDSKSPFGVLPWAIDKEYAERLWTLSEELTGVKFVI